MLPLLPLRLISPTRSPNAATLSFLQQVPGDTAHQLVRSGREVSNGYHHKSCLTFSRVLVLFPEPRFLPHSAATSLALCLSTSSSKSLPSNPPPRASPAPSSPVVGLCQSSASGDSELGEPGRKRLFPNSMLSSRPCSSSRGFPRSLGAVLGGPRREVNAEEDLDLMAMVPWFANSKFTDREVREGGRK